jgi:hypothetical protein
LEQLQELEDNIVKLTVNNTDVLQYDRSIKLPANQLNYLAMMDKKMDEGIRLGNEDIKQPEQVQKAQFVALNMLSFLDNDQQQDAIAMFSYIVHFLDKIKQVKVINDASKVDKQYNIEFVFYKDLSNWEEVKFH